MRADERPGLAGDRGPEVDSFYHLKDCALAGKACNGTACFAARQLNPERWAEAAKQTPRVYCLGKCFAAPAHADEEPARPPFEVRAREGIVLGRLARGGARSLERYLALDGYRGLEAALATPPDAAIRAVEAAGLRGRGGAAFPTGRKLRAVRHQPGAEKFVVANADEGDAGAYIDRFLLEDDPFSLLEGMTIAAYAVGAAKGWIYLRAEYPAARPMIEAALVEARAAGLLGESILGREFGFDVELVIGQGSYLCGEETALLNSIEGRRPEVRARPPFPTERGLWGRPTLVNNVETFVNLPWILRRGGEAYHALGFANSRGTKVVSLNSLFHRPGLYEVEFGVSVRHLVEELGGGLRGSAPLKGVLIGGPLAGIIPPWLLDTPFGFEELRTIGAGVGHGGVVAFDERTSIVELAQHVFAFGAYESCGKCTPCRLGSRRLEEFFTAAASGEVVLDSQAEEARRVVDALRLTSLCGHGVGLGEFAASAWRYYGKELSAWSR